MTSSSIAGQCRTRRWTRAAARLLGGFIAAILLYFLASIAGSLLPANSHWVPPREGVRIYIYSNGVHTGIVMPKQNSIKDWRTLASTRHLANPRYGASSHLLVGWGERRFYLETPTWAELNPLVAARALIYGPRTLLHIDHIHNPRVGPDMRPLTIGNKQYAELVWRIEQQFRRDRMGHVIPLPGYGPDDVFYEAKGHYSFIRTCNEWTGEHLRAIGVRVGQWTPFSYSVMRWFGG